jgi:hypothetical protein
VLDANGEVVFESGAVDSQGAIQGNDNDLDPLRYEPHYLVIDSSDQVQIYEAIMVNSDGQVTTTLLRGAEYLKDNRLLPAGFDKLQADVDIAVRGAAFDDEDFEGGGDLLGLDIDLVGAKEPFILEVELLYQSIAFRWAENFRAYQAKEPERFVRYYDAVHNTPLVAAFAKIEFSE